MLHSAAGKRGNPTTLAFPTTSEARRMIEDAVMAVYKKVVARSENQRADTK
jgi:DNA-binding cell septation regulator SpoVG